MEKIVKLIEERLVGKNVRKINSFIDEASVITEPWKNEIHIMSKNCES